MRAPRSGFQRWFGPQYQGWISYEQRPPSGKMTQFFPIRGLSLLLLPAISCLLSRCASRGSGRIQRKRYLDENYGELVQNLWDDIAIAGPQSNERLNYAT